TRLRHAGYLRRYARKERVMHRTLLSVLVVLLVSCAAPPSYQYLQGGERVDQPGVSFLLPAGQKWGAIIRSTYQSAFGALGMPKNDTLIVSTSVYNVQPSASREDFLKVVHEGRTSEPNTGRFEVVRNIEQLY